MRDLRRPPHRIHWGLTRSRASRTRSRRAGSPPKWSGQIDPHTSAAGPGEALDW